MKEVTDGLHLLNDQLLTPPADHPLLTDGVQDISASSERARAVRALLTESYLDPSFSNVCVWLPVKVQLLHNEALGKNFEDVVEDFTSRGQCEAELRERYGFVVENDIGALSALCQQGAHTRDNDYNALGYSRMGFYLCQHADVCLHHALIRFSGAPCIRILICKYVTGRHTKAIPRVASAAEFIEPTQGFDSHISVIPASRTDSLQNQFDRSQIYLYEINRLLQPSARPRQVLPYAIVTFTPRGVYHPLVDAQILMTADTHVSSDNERGAASSPLLQRTIGSRVGGEDGQESPLAATAVVGLTETGRYEGAPVRAVGPLADSPPGLSAELQSNIQLRRVVEQINSRGAIDAAGGGIGAGRLVSASPMVAPVMPDGMVHAAGYTPGSLTAASPITPTSITSMPLAPLGMVSHATFGPGAMAPGAIVPNALAPGTLLPGGIAPGGIAPGTLTPAGLTPGAFTPGSLASAALAPTALAPGALAPSALAPNALTPGAMTPAMMGYIGKAGLIQSGLFVPPTNLQRMSPLRPIDARSLTPPTAAYYPAAHTPSFPGTPVHIQIPPTSYMGASPYANPYGLAGYSDLTVAPQHKDLYPAHAVTTQFVIPDPNLYETMYKPGTYAVPTLAGQNVVPNMSLKRSHPDATAAAAQTGEKRTKYS